ncbi:NAD(P)/FAD-dependent oxidoreductase [Parvibaculum sp.]|uniref:NAD(P)/FAD-dependent oxidoreductase n=1 Tax=Parvibaculum sp. TaxID=2024848 RepID=UPI002FD8EB22
MANGNGSAVAPMRAIVIGASTTGLIAAAALSRHFEKVIVLERDTLPEEPEWRKGVPQSRHVHLLLRCGEDVISEYFPGVTDELVAAGGRRVDMAADTRWFYAGGWKARFDSGITMYCQSKGFLEWTLRRRVENLPNAIVRDKAEIDTYLVSDGAVCGVRLKTGEEVTADLVVDASGRNSKTPQRLAALGFGEVEVSELPVDVGYATRAYRIPPGKRDWLSLIVHPRYPDSRLGVIIPVEGDRWLVTLVGSRGDHPPADDEGFLEFARGLPVPDIYEAIRDAEPLTPAGLHRFPGNLRRHYERLATMPDGLVVIGDAACSFNPIYAQGMTQGATAARILDTCVARRRKSGKLSLKGFGPVFQREYAKFADQCWLISTTEEYRDPMVAAHPPLWTKFANWYLEQVHELSWSDRRAAHSFLEVMHLLRPPASLLAPPLAARVLAHGLFARAH